MRRVIFCLLLLIQATCVAHHDCIPSAKDGKIIFVGNSLVAGRDLEPGESFPAQTDALLGRRFCIVNLGVPAQTTAQMIEQGTQVDLEYDSAFRRNILVVWEGTNSLYFGKSAAEAYDELKSYCIARRGKTIKVFVLTVLPRSNSGTPGDFEKQRGELNSMLRAHSKEFADGLIDVAGNPLIGEAGAEKNYVLFSDLIHMTPAGYRIIAEMTAKAITGK